MDDNKAEETRVSFFNPPSVAEGYDTDSTEAEEEDPETAASENSALMTITSKVEEPTDGLLTFTGLHGSLIFLIGSLWAASELSMNLFSAHVVAASGFTAFLLSAISLLQQTSPRSLKKRFGLHWKLNAAALLMGAVAFAAIALSKSLKGKTHFESLHAKWGLATFVSALGIGAAGSLLKWVPRAVGGHAMAKKLYPFHRAFGYLLTGLLLVTLYYALEKKWVKEWMGSNLWTANLMALPVLAGFLLARVSWSKLVFGINQRQQ